MTGINSSSHRANCLQHISTWHNTGLTQAAYCRKHKLNPTTFNGWVKRYRNASPTTTSLTTIPVIIQPDPSTQPVPSPILLHHTNGWQLHVPADVPLNWLGRLLRELA